MRHQEDAPSATPTSPLTVEVTHQAGKLSHHESVSPSSAVAAQARFVTPQDPVIVTADGNRLPGVPLEESHQLNVLREELVIREGDETETEDKISNLAADREGQLHNGTPCPRSSRALPPSSTNPLFPPLPLYGPPSLLRDIQCLLYRITSSCLSLAFLSVIVLGALFTSIPIYFNRAFHKLTRRNIDEKRPFYEEELRNAAARKEKDKAWERRATASNPDAVDQESMADAYPPTEGGKDPIVCDVGYYARRVGLEVEDFKVQTEDGFIIDLWHVYDPKEYTRLDEATRNHGGPDVFQGSKKKLKYTEKKRKFPVLLMHGLLQSSGSYCCNDDQSLAFWLCKSGFDVWLGNNRCGFKPQHVLLEHSDPRMWCWNIRQMGVFDLPALTSRVLSETGFEKLGLICHSQGTTQTFVALAREQRPDLGEKLTVFCALAPAAYAGPLIGKMYLKFMRVISPTMFRLMFGIHAFIPFMMQMHAVLNPRLYGWLGYKVFSFLFDWSDERWDRGLRDRMFQFAPVYVSAESMRWWLGRECFAKHKCILATKEVLKAEERMDAAQPQVKNQRGATAWYNEQVPPFALWVCGHDNLVDGERLLRRFETGREPHVKVVHSKVIPAYQHLDVIWAMDAAEQVFQEIREVLWKTCHAREMCRVPDGCDMVLKWEPDAAADETDDGQQSSSGSED